MTSRFAVAVGAAAVVATACGGWTGPDGQDAPRSIIEESRGGDCGNPDLTYLFFRGEVYARDVHGELDPQEDTAGPFLADADLPSDAEDTGFKSSGRHLFDAPSERGESIFIVEGDSVERWPRYNMRYCL